MNDNRSTTDQHVMDDGQLSELLAAMPREKAAADFTARVLERIEATPSKSAAPRWPGSVPLLAAAALLFISLGFGGRELWHRHQRQETIARYEALRAEHEALEAELHRLRRLAVEARPVLYLGGDETVEYVVDLSGPQRRREGAYPALGSSVHMQPQPKEATPDMPTAGTETGTEAVTEMDDLSPSQLRQHPRRIY